MGTLAVKGRRSADLGGLMGWQKSLASTEEINARISQLPDALRPIREEVQAISAPGIWIEGGPSGPLLAGRRPDVAPHAYDIVLFAPLPRKTIEEYQYIHDFNIPDAFVDFLEHINGCGLFSLNVYGVPPSMAANPPLLNRSQRSPLDIGTGRYWRAGYGDVDHAHVLIASRNIGSSGQVGYFMNPQGRILGRGNGSEDAPATSGPWETLTEWMSAELADIRQR